MLDRSATSADAATHQAVCPALKAMGMRPDAVDIDTATSGTQSALVSGSDAQPDQSRAVRYGLAAVGVGCVGMGALGVFVPGLPTTVFLIIATWCFARSCPWLTARLIDNRLFAPFLVYLQPGAVMPKRAKVIAMAMMWSAIALSGWLLVLRDTPFWVIATIVLAGLVGTWYIARQGRAGRTLREPQTL